MKVALLDALAVYTLGIGETKEAFLEMTADQKLANPSKALKWNDTHSFPFQKAKAKLRRP